MAPTSASARKQPLLFFKGLIDIVTSAARLRRIPGCRGCCLEVVLSHGLYGRGYQFLPLLGNLHGVVGITFLCKIFFRIPESILEYFGVLHGALRIPGRDVWLKVFDRFIEIAHQIVIVIMQVEITMLGICGTSQCRRTYCKWNGEFPNHGDFPLGGGCCPR